MESGTKDERKTIVCSLENVVFVVVCVGEAWHCCCAPTWCSVAPRSVASREISLPSDDNETGGKRCWHGCNCSNYEHFFSPTRGESVRRHYERCLFIHKQNWPTCDCFSFYQIHADQQYVSFEEQSLHHPENRTRNQNKNPIDCANEPFVSRLLVDRVSQSVVNMRPANWMQFNLSFIVSVMNRCALHFCFVEGNHARCSGTVSSPRWIN